MAQGHVENIPYNVPDGGLFEIYKERFCSARIKEVQWFHRHNKLMEDERAYKNNKPLALCDASCMRRKLFDLMGLMDVKGFEGFMVLYASFRRTRDGSEEETEDEGDS